VHVTLAKAGQSATRTAIPSEAAAKSGAEEEILHFKTLKEPNMTTKNTTDEAMGGFLAAATQNVRYGGDIAIATTQVIAKRVALGVAATFNPLGADRAEFSRMVPEKVEAFSAASVVLLEQSHQANRQMMCLVSDEVMTTARATIEMTGCFNPATLAETQGRFARAWFSRVASSWITMGSWGLEAQSAAMAPIRQTVVANAERLAQ
jgi:hypothetical protein